VLEYFINTPRARKGRRNTALRTADSVSYPSSVGRGARRDRARPTAKPSCGINVVRVPRCLDKSCSRSAHRKTSVIREDAATDACRQEGAT